MKTSIALIGFMGTGKTTVGQSLARRLGKDFIETDALIEQQAGKSIAEVFKDKGETGFREIEIGVIKQIAERKNAVIACGGGVVLNRINVDRLRRECVVVLLTASPRAVVKRIPQDGNIRPLLQVADIESIKQLLAFRKPFYERAADITVNTSRLNIEGVVDQIVKQLNEIQPVQSCD